MTKIKLKKPIFAIYNFRSYPPPKLLGLLPNVDSIKKLFTDFYETTFENCVDGDFDFYYLERLKEGEPYKYYIRSDWTISVVRLPESHSKLIADELERKWHGKKSEHIYMIPPDGEIVKQPKFFTSQADVKQGLTAVIDEAMRVYGVDKRDFKEGKDYGVQDDHAWIDLPDEELTYYVYKLVLTDEGGIEIVD